MKTKRVNRYYCDHCKKQGGSASRMSRHEKRCTLNPNRECGVCDLLGVAQERMRNLAPILPDPAQYGDTDELGRISYDEALTDCANKCLKWLREACDNCPACIMAAIRQRGIPVPMVTEFDWSKEMKAVWAEVNDRNAQECFHG